MNANISPRARLTSKVNRYSALPLLVPMILAAILSVLGVIDWGVLAALLIAALLIAVLGLLSSKLAGHGSAD